MGGGLGPGFRSGSRAGPLGHGMVVCSTGEVWTPIKDWMLGSRSGPRDGILGPGLKVWDPDVDPSHGWRYGSWEGDSGPEGGLGPAGRSGLWAGPLGQGMLV